MGSTKIWVAMTAALLFAVTGLVYAISVASGQPPRNGDMIGFDTEAGNAAPAVTFADAAGRPVTWDDFRGQVLLVNFWATWCAPCVHEMPSLDTLQNALGGEDFEVVAISVDQGGQQQVEGFYRAHGLRHLEVYTDPRNRVPAAFGARGLPTSVVIGRNGEWLGTFVGAADWAGPDAMALIRHYLDDPA